MKNKLIDLLPEAKKYYDYDKNKNVDIESLTIASTTKCYWKCPECGHVQYASANEMVVKNQNGSYRFRICKECQKKQSREKNRLVDLLPYAREYFNFEKTKTLILNR